MSMEFQLLIKTRMLKNKDFFAFIFCIHYALQFYNANNCWHFTIYQQDKFHAQLSRAWNKFYKLRARPRDYETFMLNSTEHEISNAHTFKTKITEEIKKII